MKRKRGCSRGAGALGAAFVGILLVGAALAEPLRGPETWLEFLGGNVRKDGLRCDLEAMKAAGISGVQFFHIGGIAYDGVDRTGGVWAGCEEQIPCMSEKWWDVIRFLGDECARLGLGLTVQNCPGWSQSGGPWVDLDHCQRDIAMARADLAAGERIRLPEVPKDFRDGDSDWRDICVLAFRTPTGDAQNDALSPDSTSTNGNVRIYRFGRPVTIRSFDLQPCGTWNSAHVYAQPWVRARMEVETPAGWREVVRTTIPISNWRDYLLPFTVACGDATGTVWRLSIEHDRAIAEFRDPVFRSSARMTDWQGKSARTLRSLAREPMPKQDACAWLDPSTLVDLTGRSDWVAPSGRWTVLRLGSVNCKYVNAPAPKEATGWECDKLDPVGIEANFNGYIRRLNEGVLKGKMRAMLVDSWECFTQTWTPKMERYFREANGYELRPWLPALFGWIVGSPDATEKFLADWRRTTGDLVTKNYYGRMAEFAHAAGLEAYYETAFGDIICGDLLEYWKYADAPMCEFWYPHTDVATGHCGCYSFKPIRPCASAAHVYGKPRVVAEAFTGWGIHWNEDFKRLRDVANRHYARGVTHFAFQSYTHAPRPDDLPPGGCMGGYNGTPFTRLQTWWKRMPEFTGWLARCEEHLEKGLPAEDVLWYLGDAVDHKPDELYPFPEGFRADYVNHDVLTNRLAVKDGFFEIPEGVRWKVLWVPDERFMLPATAAALGRLAAAGGRVVRGGRAALVRALACLEKDVATDPALGDEPSEDFMWIHRKDGAVERYFVAAGTNGYSGRVTFRAEGAAEIYDPVTNRRRAWTNGSLLDLRPSESVFVEIDARKSAKHVAPPVREVLGDLALGPWKLAFAPGWDAPAEVKLKTPVSWTDIPGFSAAARAYSGTVVYETAFDIGESDLQSSGIILDLGRVESMARVFVNGRAVRTLWCEPFSCDLAPYAKAGRNALRIEVTNTWRNRVIHDLGLPEKDRKTWILYKEGYNPGPKDPLDPSGILGPVRIRRVREGPARFISPVSKGPRQDAAVFERRFAPRGEIRRAVWRFTALGVFEAFVNGERAGADFLKPGFTEAGKCRHVYTADVTRLLRPGAANLLSATVTPGWWCDMMMLASKRLPWQTGEEVAFWGELHVDYADGTSETVPTDTRWLAAYSGPTVTAGIYEGERVDAARVPERLRPAKLNGEFHGELRPAAGKIALRHDLEMKPVGLRVVRGTEGASDAAFGRAKTIRHPTADERIELRPGEMLVIDFGQNASAVPSFVAEGTPWAKVTVRFSEMLNERNGERARGNDGPAGTPYLAALRSAPATYVVTPAEKPRRFQPSHTFFGYRYLSVTTDERVTVSDFRSTPVSSVTREMERSRLTTGNARVNRLIENIRWGMRSNYLSIPTDCPQRDERMGWTADTQVFMRSAAYLIDTREFLGKYLADLRDAQHPDGLYPCFVPNVRHLFPHWASAGWTDAGVIIPYRLWKWYGSTAHIEASWDSMERYMGFLASDPTPYRINHGDWLAFEHCAKNADGSDGEHGDPRQVAVLNAYFRIWMARLMKEMAAATGRTATSERYAAEEDRLHGVFAKGFLGGDGCLKPEYRGQCNDLYMLKLGLCGNAAAREATKRDLVENIRRHGDRLQTGFLGTAILMPTLTFEAEAGDLAYSLLLQDKFPSWLYSVDQGATTIWERWNGYTKEKGFGPVIMNSFNHYAYGCVLEWIYSAAAGIRQTKGGIGWKRFVLAPIPDRRLGSVDAVFASPEGEIASRWSYAPDGSWMWTFTVPAGTSAEVSVPGRAPRTYGSGTWTERL